MFYRFVVYIAWLTVATSFVPALQHANILSRRSPISRLSAGTASGVESLSGIRVTRVSSNTKIDLGQELRSKQGTSLVVLSTYAADFNALEYAQRVRHYQSRLKEKGVTNFLMVLNADPAAATGTVTHTHSRPTSLIRVHSLALLLLSRLLT